MHTPQIVPLRRAACPAIGNVLARAFHDDPVWKFLSPDDALRPKQLRWLFSRWSVLMADLGESYVVADGCGVALWAPGGGKKPGLLGLARLGVQAPFAMGPGWTKRMLQMMRDSEQRRAAEMPRGAWELNTIGVDPGAHGRGIGGALLRRVLDRTDADGLPVYVQTHNPINIPYYERHGFQLIRKAPTVPGRDVYTCSLIRRPRPVSSARPEVC